MKAQHLLLLLLPVVVEAYIASTPSASFVGRPSAVVSSSSYGAASMWKMDMEGDSIDHRSRINIEKMLQDKRSLDKFMAGPTTVSVEEAESAHGMPWTTSIDSEAQDLLYMPFWEWQMDFMKENLTNLRVQPCESSTSNTDFSYTENSKKKARLVNLCFSSDEYRKIRMTYYDAGDSTQVFNSVWYPSPEYNLPVLGVDLLSFNRKKYLAIVDFQPLHDTEDQHAATYEDLLQPIKDKYESLKGRMSSKFYDETKFFSQQMLFARFEDEGVVADDLMPAFQQYVQTHLNLIRSTDADPSERRFVMERQKAYDTYSAERDPATGLFAAMFGKEWADDFVFDFLFSLSERTEGGVQIIPPMGMMMGGGGPPSQGQGAQRQQQAARKPAAAPR